ncbi:hypothetical protein [Alcanivorax quisquiliarum]|uniref:Uncharacterized protein n=1 Tax=Alcanivorax quisquiliarum TaxID=2933565 RepID=A0ABT0E691_9GAMM|nr:hypothetical protein [Alcanivorax quisquiliarum]MCK0537194.1 hypothetical protein [Alcanivorax quisquiliarum]
MQGADRGEFCAGMLRSKRRSESAVLTFAQATVYQAFSTKPAFISLSFIELSASNCRYR